MGLIGVILMACSRLDPAPPSTPPATVAAPAPTGTDSAASQGTADRIAAAQAPAFQPTAAPTSQPAIGSALPAPRTSGLPRFEALATCPSGVARCGYVVVPERHARPDGPTIRLAVDVYERMNLAAPPEPAVYLQGGPGVKRSSTTQAIWRIATGAVRQNRDVILYDQRGVGQSRPSLDCPELDQARFEIAEHGLDFVTAPQRFGAIEQCRDRLQGTGADLAAYTTAESVADLDDIRAALGYERVNLVGMSYGTYLAQAAMRAHPTRIRSVVLDSVVPLDIQIRAQPFTAEADAALEQTFVLCAADPACNRAFPRLRDRYLQLLTRLAQQPVRVPVPGDSTRSVLIDARRFGRAVYDRMYLGPSSVPLLITTTDRGDYRHLSEEVLKSIRTLPSYAEGYSFSVNCKRLADTHGPARPSGSGPLTRLGPYPSLVESCQSWPTDRPDPTFSTPLRSELPTMIVAGQLDPATPPAYGQRVARGLPNSVYVEMPGQGHVPSVYTVCGRSIVADFLDDPTRPPDTACADALKVAFNLP